MIDSTKAQKDMDVLALRLDKLLKFHKSLKLNVVGYTSSPASFAYNEKLSRNRANTIKTQLLHKIKKSNHDFKPGRISFKGRGERKDFRKYVNDTVDSVDRAGNVSISKSRQTKSQPPR